MGVLLGLVLGMRDGKSGREPCCGKAGWHVKTISVEGCCESAFDRPNEPPLHCEPVRETNASESPTSRMSMPAARSVLRSNDTASARGTTPCVSTETLPPRPSCTHTFLFVSRAYNLSTSVRSEFGVVICTDTSLALGEGACPRATIVTAQMIEAMAMEMRNIERDTR